MVAYAGFVVTGAAWALSASFAGLIGAIASVILLATALRNSWAITLTIMGRPAAATARARP